MLVLVNQNLGLFSHLFLLAGCHMAAAGEDKQLGVTKYFSGCSCTAPENKTVYNWSGCKESRCNNGVFINCGVCKVVHSTAPVVGTIIKLLSCLKYCVANMLLLPSEMKSMMGGPQWSNTSLLNYLILNCDEQTYRPPRTRLPPCRPFSPCDGVWLKSPPTPPTPPTVISSPYQLNKQVEQSGEFVSIKWMLTNF